MFYFTVLPTDKVIYSVGGRGIKFEKRAVVNDNDKRIFPNVTLFTTNLK